MNEKEKEKFVLVAYAQTGIYLTRLLRFLGSTLQSDRAVHKEASELLELLKNIKLPTPCYTNISDDVDKCVSSKFKRMVASLLSDSEGCAGRFFCVSCDLILVSRRQWKNHNTLHFQLKSLETIVECNNCGITIRVIPPSKEIYLECVEHKITDIVARFREVRLARGFMIDLKSDGENASSYSEIKCIPPMDTKCFFNWVTSDNLYSVSYRCLQCRSPCMNLHPFIGHVESHHSADAIVGIVCRLCSQFILACRETDVKDHIEQSHFSSKKNVFFPQFTNTTNSPFDSNVEAIKTHPIINAIVSSPHPPFQSEGESHLENKSSITPEISSTNEALRKKPKKKTISVMPVVSSTNKTTPSNEKNQLEESTTTAIVSPSPSIGAFQSKGGSHLENKSSITPEIFSTNEAPSSIGQDQPELESTTFSTGIMFSLPSIIQSKQKKKPKKKTISVMPVVSSTNETTPSNEKDQLKESTSTAIMSPSPSSGAFHSEGGSHLENKFSITPEISSMNEAPSSIGQDQPGMESTAFSTEIISSHPSIIQSKQKKKSKKKTISVMSVVSFTNETTPSNEKDQLEESTTTAIVSPSPSSGAFQSEGGSHLDTKSSITPEISSMNEAPSSIGQDQPGMESTAFSTEIFSSLPSIVQSKQKKKSKKKTISVMPVVCSTNEKDQLVSSSTAIVSPPPPIEAFQSKGESPLENKSSSIIPVASLTNEDPPSNGEVQQENESNFALTEVVLSSSVPNTNLSSGDSEIKNGFDKKFLLFLRYLRGRCEIEGFIPSSTTGFYCGLCFYASSYYVQWRAHLKSIEHLLVLKKFEDIRCMAPCVHCGLVLCLQESDMAKYMTCIQHKDLDRLAAVSPPTKKHLRPPQTRAQVKKLQIANATFVEDCINHDVCCVGFPHTVEDSLPVNTRLPKIILPNKSVNDLHFIFTLDPNVKRSVSFIFQQGKFVKKYLTESLLTDWVNLINHHPLSLKIICMVCSNHCLRTFAPQKAAKHMNSQIHHMRNLCSEEYGFLCAICGFYIVTNRIDDLMDHLKTRTHMEKVLTMNDLGELCWDVSNVPLNITDQNPQMMETLTRVSSIFKNFVKDSPPLTDKTFSFGVMPRPNIEKHNVLYSELCDVGSAALESCKGLWYTCLVCDPNRACDIKKMDDHLKSRGHSLRISLTTITDDSEDEEDEEDSQKEGHVGTSCYCSGKVWTCHVCYHTYLCANIIHIETHMESNHHFSNALRRFWKHPPLNFNSHVYMTVGDVEYEVKYLRDLSSDALLNFLETKKMIHFVCQRCNSPILNTKSLIRQHARARRHVTICSCVPANFYPFIIYCNLCENSFATYDINPHNAITIHVVTERHVNSKKLDINKGLSDECIKMISSSEALCYNVFQSLVDMNMTMDVFEAMVHIIREDLLALVVQTYPQARVHFFGSRMTGLAKCNSDVDIFLDTGDLFYGSYLVPQGNRIQQIAQLIHRQKSNFQVTRIIADTRVPILRLEHTLFNVKCDLNSYDGSGVENSRLIKLYLKMDLRVVWVMKAVFQWFEMNCIKCSERFPSYSVIWMVLYYLMQPDISLVPPVIFLMDLYVGPKILISGWDYSYFNRTSVILEHHNPELMCKMSRMQLLEGFFHFYQELDVRNLVLCPLTGDIVPREAFSKAKSGNCTNLPPRLLSYFNSNPSSQDTLRMNNAVVLLDPFVLKFNMLRRVKPILWGHFRLLCQETLQIGEWKDNRPNLC